MAVILMCAYGDCQETMRSGVGFKLTVTTTFDGDRTNRKSFCCYEHAALWLNKLDREINGPRAYSQVGR